MSKIVEEIKGFIIDKLEDMEGSEYYLCDIGMELSESENCNGSWYCSSFEVKQAIKENWNLCGDFFEYYKSEFGMSSENPFENPELFHCQMMIFAVSNSFNYALNKTDFSDMWNEKIEITEEFVNEIKKTLEDLIESDIF